MLKYLSQYITEYDEALNIDLMKKNADEPLVDYIIDSWKSLEVVPNIKCKNFTYTERESEIDINKHIFKREKKRKKKDRYDYKFIDDDRCGKLTVELEITLLETNMETGEKFIHCYPLKKSMLVPIQDEDGYYYIKGKKYYLIYQIVEKSTYTSSNSVTLKSLMPIAIKRNVVEAKVIDNFEDETVGTTYVETDDIHGNHYKLPFYTIFVFKKEVPVILFYMAKGVDFTLDFLEVSNVIRFLPETPNVIDPEYLYFQISNRCVLEVNRELFNKYPYIQSIVGGFLYVCTNRVTIEQLNDPKTWIKKISGTNNYDKGKSILQFFNRFLDKCLVQVKPI